MIKIEMDIRISGDYTEQELKDFIEFELQGGSIDTDNPFVRDESNAEITRVDVY